MDELRVLSAFFRSVADFVIIILDEEGRILSWNPAADRVLGYAEKEVIGEYFGFLFTDEDREAGFPKREIETSLREGTAEDYRWHRRKDGSRFWSLGVLTAIFDKKAKLQGFVKLARDVSYHKNREDELRKAKEAAETANDAKSLFLAMMSHELRTPLAAMIGFADALLDSQVNDEQRTHAETIAESGRHLATLIDNILDLSKVEAGRLETERHQFLLDKLLREVIALLKPRIDQKKLTLRLKVSNSIPEAIISDPSRLRQILINIIGNAIKFTEEGVVSISVHLQKRNGSGLIGFRVSDSGMGIPEDKQGQLFQPFMQVDGTIARRYGGTGLGLVLSRRLARALGGDVELEWSKPGQGSCFLVTVETGPLDRVRMIDEIDIAQLGSKARQAQANEPLKGFRVLVVDDAQVNRFLIENILKRLGCSQVDLAENGKLAIQKAEQGDYDLMLLDMQMPEVDGFEAAASLRKKGYARPIIALTAYAMKEELELCLAVGCDAVLVKPIDSKKLIEAILFHCPKPGRDLADGDFETLH